MTTARSLSASAARILPAFRLPGKLRETARTPRGCRSSSPRGGPRGRPLDQERVRRLAAGPGAVLVCGRFEGVDERVLDARGVEEVSLGDFVLSGGEPAAIVLIDACVRLLPGVIGDPAALEVESFAGGLLEHPQYTRPQLWEGREVPEVLLSGHHERIRAWRVATAEELTKARRRDLWERYRAERVRGPKNEPA